MLFADEFWKPPNVYDAAGVAGLVIGIASIWLSWWLARRDLEKRIEKAADRAARAAREEVRRVADALLSTGLRDVIRALDLAREACRGTNWNRAAELCVHSAELLARVLGQPRLAAELRAELETQSATLTNCVARLRRLKNEATKLPPVVALEIDETLLTLHRIEGTMGAIRLEADGG